MKYYLIYRPRLTNRYCIVSETPLYRTDWAYTPLDLFSKVVFTHKWNLLKSKNVKTSFKDQIYQVIATFDSEPTLEYIKSNHPELLL